MYSVREIEKILFDWLIPTIKWKSDNIGLQVGDYNLKVKKILIALNPTLDVVNEAVSTNCNLIITHHPLIFFPIKNIISGKDNSDTIRALIKNNISLISCHTNFDLVKDGVSYLLAKELGLNNIKPLVPLNRMGEDVEVVENYKLIAYVPIDYSEKLKKYLAEAGAATIGKYDNCFFNSQGIGNFKPLGGSKPFIGQKNKINDIEEVKLETIVPSWKLNQVLDALIKYHPYEEPAYDVFKLENNSNNFGLGVYGDFSESLSSQECLKLIAETLNSNSLRISAKRDCDKIKRIAIVGGSGAKYYKDAARVNADLYLTSECSHHTFLDAEKTIFIVDATHQATEQFAVKGFKCYLERALKQASIFVSKKDKDPIELFKI